MEKNKISCIFVIIFLAATMIAPVAAVSLSFVDGAYMKANDYIITDQSGTTVSNFTGSSTVTLPAGKSYSVNFVPNGLFDLSKESPGSLSSVGTTLDFFRQNLAGLIALSFILLAVAIWVKK